MSDANRSVSSDPDTPFEVGLVMSGAISAGAYTAGVLDFLIQALDEWQGAKDSGETDCPPHDVRIKVMAGASAGGMTAALSVGMLSEAFDYATTYPATMPVNNKLFDSWVNKIDIGPLLGDADLQDMTKPVQSLLDSTILARIAADAFNFDTSAAAPNRPYLADPLHIIVTVTNLRGVPFQLGFDNSAPIGYQMMLHGDYVHFTSSPSGKPGNGSIALPPRRYAEPGWQTLQVAALATGAFPVGLSPRALSFPASSYSGRTWLNFPAADASASPFWPLIEAQTQSNAEFAYNYVSVDGGVIDNDPLDLAHTILFDDAKEVAGGRDASRALIMIDPFPNAADFPADYTGPASLVEIVQQTFSSLMDQARFQPDQLAKAADPEVFSRFLIVPDRRDDADKEQTYTIACGSLEGFGGFLSRDFRQHDFFLGRRNCQWFLRNHFALPYAGPSAPGRNSLFDDWTDAARQRYQIVRTSKGDIRPKGQASQPGDVVLLPIIPLMGTADKEVAHVDWPTFTADDFDTLRPLIKNRAHTLGHFVIDKNFPGFLNALTRGNLLLGWDILEGIIVNKVMQIIADDLKLRGLA